jgi:hypothetical protein
VIVFLPPTYRTSPSGSVTANIPLGVPPFLTAAVLQVCQILFWGASLGRVPFVPVAQNPFDETLPRDDVYIDVFVE